jgi:hypothetical protein
VAGHDQDRRHYAISGQSGRIFRSERGAIIAFTASEVWQESRTLALSPRPGRLTLARRQYDLRHAVDVPGFTGHDCY